MTNCPNCGDYVIHSGGGGAGDEAPSNKVIVTTGEVRLEPHTVYELRQNGTVEARDGVFYFTPNKDR